VKLPKFRYIALSGFVFGLAVSIASLIYIAKVAGAGSMWTVVIWPTSIMMLGPEVGPRLGTLCVSIALNGVWYAIIFAVLWSICWVFYAVAHIITRWYHDLTNR
jgi:Zn-dependent protease